MQTSTPVADAVAARLGSFIARMRADALEYGSDAVALIDAAAATLDGGKRLRARFCHSGWRSVARLQPGGGCEPETLWDACAALEIFQSAALVHDDLIDNSDTRRGRPAAHRALQSEHTRAGWSGDAASFGRSAAILLGDLLVAWSDDLIEEAIAALPHSTTVRREYARMRRDVTVGQFLDIAEESAWSVHPSATHLDRALRVASLKSARYSIEQPLVLGGAMADGSAAQISALRAFGHPLGMAFQLRDDMLGVFGETSVTGKPAGDDLREGKRTVLVALTRTELEPTVRTVFDELLGDQDLTRDQVEFLQATILRSGAADRVETMIDDYASQAHRALSGADLDNAAVNDLRDLARAATSRSA